MVSLLQQFELRDPELKQMVSGLELYSLETLETTVWAEAEPWASAYCIVSERFHIEPGLAVG